MQNGDRAAAREDEALHLRFAARLARIRSGDPGSLIALRAVYQALRSDAGDPDLDYVIERENARFVLRSTAGGARAAGGLGTLLAVVDEELAIGFQRLRQDLLFLHAAALEFRERAFLLVAPSGGGKSTTTWVLLHHGFRYLSDELAPVEPEGLTVHPYPRALGLKGEPPRPFGLPAGALVCGRNAWVTTAAVRMAGGEGPMPLAAIFFLNRRNAGLGGGRLTVSEAAVRLYPNTLNALAHPADGLDAVIGVAARTACFALPTQDLTATPRLVQEVLDRLI